MTYETMEHTWKDVARKHGFHHVGLGHWVRGEWIIKLDSQFGPRLSKGGKLVDGFVEGWEEVHYCSTLEGCVHLWRRLTAEDTL